MSDPADAARAFAQDGYVLVAGLIAPQLADFLWSYVHTRLAGGLLDSGGPLVPGSLGGYGDPAFDGLLEHLRPRIEQACGLALHPTYSHFRLYGRGAELPPHRDRAACEISVSLNVGQTPTEPWPMHVEAAADPIPLGPGDALVYRGIELAHWRGPYPGRQLVQAFLHYVDRNGPHADRRFDGRASLMRPPAAPSISPLSR
jgi:hypothetical protein